MQNREIIWIIIESKDWTRLQGPLDECFPSIPETKNHLECMKFFKKLKSERRLLGLLQKTELECPGESLDYTVTSTRRWHLRKADLVQFSVWNLNPNLMWFLRLDVHTTRLGSCFAFSVESRASTDVPLEWSPVPVFCLFSVFSEWSFAC